MKVKKPKLYHFKENKKGIVTFAIEGTEKLYKWNSNSRTRNAKNVTFINKGDNKWQKLLLYK